MYCIETATEIKLNNILYLTDFSEPAEAALPFVTAIAREYGSKIYAFHSLLPDFYRIVAETRGNPLALLDLPGSMSAAELAGGFDVPAVTDRPRHLENHHLRRAGELPEATQRLLLLVAAEPIGDATLIWRAAHGLGIEQSSLAPAEDAQLVEVGARVRFRHPLVRSAVYRAAVLSERRAAHRALAEATDSDVDPDRRRRGIVPARRWVSTRRWPPSWSARPTGRRPVEARPRPRRSWRTRLS